MTIALVKYNAGNVQSVVHALNRLHVEPVLTDDAEQLRAADKVIFPGVGEASSAMRYLRERGMDTVIAGLTKPVLGICLGLQLLCRHSEENDTDCLGIFDIAVKKFPSGNLKVPHMGWNEIDDLTSPVLADLPGHHVYFVHSYYAEMCKQTIATTNYGLPFSAALHRDNFYATQFHPEKSGIVGAKILENFLTL